MVQWADSNSLVTHTQRETTEIIRQCNMDEGIAYNPHRCIFINISDMCEKSVLDPIPRTQHRPMCVTIYPVIVPQPTTSRRRFNLKTAQLDGVSTQFDAAIEEVNSTQKTARFIELLRVVSRRHIIRGCRSNDIPGPTEESKSLYEAYKRQHSSNPFGEGTLENGTKLIDKMK